jgi:hypothetical protein
MSVRAGFSIMKMPLRVSIVLNAILLAALGAALAYRPKPPATEVAPPPNPAPEVAVAAPAPFHWSQLESSNGYRAYVANLRAIGCPESTIRAIVTADFETAAKSMQRKTEAGVPNANRFTPEAMKQTIASVLGETNLSTGMVETSVAPSAVAGNTTSQPAALQSTAQSATRAPYPVVLQNAVLNDPNLTEAQKAAVRQMQQQFVDAVGGPNQDPSDPNYAARWHTAQQDADEALRAQLGNQAYLTYKMQHYYSNFHQVIIGSDGGNVTINPDALAN